MSEIEGVFTSEDHGKDLSSVQHLLNKHQHLEQDIQNHGEAIEAVKDQSAQFTRDNHFMVQEIQERADTIISR